MTQSTKTDNHNMQAKIDLRLHFLRKYHADGKARVLDCCMGGGHLWRAIRKEHEVASYLGLDLKPKPGRLKIDSSRYLQATGWTHDVVDIDTYGSPWRHWFYLLANMGDACTVFLTIGMVRVGGGGNMMTEARRALGIDGLPVPVSILGKLDYLAADYCLAAASRYGVKITEAQEMESDGTARYIGVQLYRIGINSDTSNE